MVGGHDVDRPVREALVHRRRVMRCDVVRERVRPEPLDVGPVVVQPEAPRVDLGRHGLPPVLRRPQHLDDPLRLGVQEVQSDPGRLLKTEQRTDGAIPDDAVIVGIGLGVRAEVALTLGPVLLLDRVHERLVVGVDHERQPGRLDRLHALVELAVLVQADPRHVRVRAAGIDHHEDLEREDPALGELRDLVELHARRVHVPVDLRALPVDLHHPVEILRVGGRGTHVRHRDRDRHPAGGALRTDVREILLVRVPGLAVMGVHIDHPRERDEVLGLDLSRALRRLARILDRRDPSTGDRDVSAAHAVLQHHGRTADHDVVRHTFVDPPMYRTVSSCIISRTSMSSSRSTRDRSHSTIIGMTSPAYCLYAA